MANLSSGDIVILVGAVYLAIMTLVRLMRSRREALVTELRAEAQRERERQRIEERRRRKEAEKNRNRHRRPA